MRVFSFGVGFVRFSQEVEKARTSAFRIPLQNTVTIVKTVGLEGPSRKGLRARRGRVRDALRGTMSERASTIPTVVTIDCTVILKGCPMLAQALGPLPTGGGRGCGWLGETVVLLGAMDRDDEGRIGSRPGRLHFGVGIAG